MLSIQYSITKHIELETPHIRVNYVSKYHTGSHPICDYRDALYFIKNEFGEGKLAYAMGCLRTEIAEQIFKVCKENRLFDNNIRLRDFIKDFE